MEFPPDDVPRHFLNPCMIFVHRDEHLISTVLGSCVSVCLWDPRMACGGMNHYMLPLWNGEGLPTPKFGNIAIETLVRKMLDLGCAKDRLLAKVFGGGNVLNVGSGLYSVGERNTVVAQELLLEHGIRIAASDTGGNRGRKILFHTATGVVLVGKLGSEGDTPGSAPALPDGRPKNPKSIP